jgi:hypothetical protein
MIITFALRLMRQQRHDRHDPFITNGASDPFRLHAGKSRACKHQTSPGRRLLFLLEETNQEADESIRVFS